MPPCIEAVCRLVGYEEQLLLEWGDGSEDVNIALQLVVWVLIAEGVDVIDDLFEIF